jgi:hypothetical protein
MSATPSNPLITRVISVGLGLTLCVSSARSWVTESHRDLTSQTGSGVLSNLHTVYQTRNDKLHFNIVSSDGAHTRDLYTDEGLLYVKTIEGQLVDATFTRDTGYVSRFHILSGRSAGYGYDEPDQRDTFGAGTGLLLGLLLIGFPLGGWITDRMAREN